MLLLGCHQHGERDEFLVAVSRGQGFEFAVLPLHPISEFQYRSFRGELAFVEREAEGMEQV
ncbi:hypothetical protein AA303_17780 [Pseudomonas psychrophila]|nr:hypothetical protein AA303_17780 [Pseudomonas psychrophila]